MSDIETEARRALEQAERTVQVQRARLDALKDPVTALAAQLHTLLGCRWCNEALHFEPGWIASDPLDGWAISQEHVNRQYLTAAARIEHATRGKISPSDVGEVLRVVVTALRDGDAERFQR